MDKFILDTNLFFNMGADLGLGDNTEKIITTITEKILSLKKAGLAEFFMPPRAVDELLSFFENKTQAFLKNFLSSITIKSPEVDGLSFPAAVFYKMVDDIRGRSLRGLNIGEEEIVASGRKMLGEEKNLSQKDFQIKIGEAIKKFRERYRNATRTGFLDSLTDLDIIVLAKEQGGFLVTTDEGVLAWGRAFGAKELPSPSFIRRLDDLASLRHQE